MLILTEFVILVRLGPTGIKYNVYGDSCGILVAAMIIWTAMKCTALSRYLGLTMSDKSATNIETDCQCEMPVRFIELGKCQ
jgi:hypothetical protein